MTDIRPFWKRKRVLIPAVSFVLLMLLSVIAAATDTQIESDAALRVNRTLGTGVSDKTSGSGIPANPGQIYPGRPFIRNNDHEARLGTATAYNDWNVTLLGYDVTAEDNSIRVDLHTHVYNRSNDSRKASPGHWTLLNYSSPGEGDTKSVSSGDDRELTVTFQIPKESAGIVVAHQSDTDDSARGIVMIRVELDAKGKAVAVPWTYNDGTVTTAESGGEGATTGSAADETELAAAQDTLMWSCSSTPGSGGLAEMPWLDVTQASATLDNRSLTVTIDVAASPNNAPPGNDPFWALYLSPDQFTNIFEANGYQVSAYHYPNGTEFLFFDGDSMLGMPGAITGGFTGDRLTMSVDRSYMPNLTDEVYAFVATEGALPEFVEDSCGGSDNSMTPMTSEAAESSSPDVAAPGPTSSDAETFVIDVESVLNVRSSANFGPVIARVRPSSLVRLTGRAQPDDESGINWVEIADLNGIAYGWVSDEFLSKPSDLGSVIYANRHSIVGNEFGTDLEDVVFPEEMTDVLGSPKRVEQTDGGIALGWPGGLRLGFTDKKLSDWSIGQYYGFDPINFQLSFEGTRIDQVSAPASVTIGRFGPDYYYRPSTTDLWSWDGLHVSGVQTIHGLTGTPFTRPPLVGTATVDWSTTELTNGSFADPSTGTSQDQQQAYRHEAPPAGTVMLVEDFDTIISRPGPFSADTSFTRLRLPEGGSAWVLADSVTPIEIFDDRLDGFRPGQIAGTASGVDDAWFATGAQPTVVPTSAPVLTPAPTSVPRPADIARAEISQAGYGQNISGVSDGQLRGLADQVCRDAERFSGDADLLVYASSMAGAQGVSVDETNVVVLAVGRAYCPTTFIGLG